MKKTEGLAIIIIYLDMFLHIARVSLRFSFFIAVVNIFQEINFIVTIFFIRCSDIYEQ